MFNNLKNFLDICKKHRILIRLKDRKIGIVATLIGWALIALGTVFFQESVKRIPYSVNFFIQFLGATFVVLLFGINKRKSIFKVQEEDNLDKKQLLSVKERKKLLLIRGIIAVLGYMCYAISAVFIHEIDNSAIFSADAVIYWCIATFLLKEKIKWRQLLGIIISTVGIMYIFFIDIQSIGVWSGILVVSFGLLSSIALAAIILMGSIMVQHDPPVRIALYQCLIGLICSIIILFIGFIFKDIEWNFSLNDILHSFFTGLFYGMALLFFFNALLYAEPLLIAVLGYSLTLFVEFFYWGVNHQGIILNDVVSAFVIFFGCILVIFDEYRKKEKVVLGYHSPLHSFSLTEEMNSLMKNFKEKKIDFFHYMAAIHEYNKLLFVFPNRIKDSILEKIELTKKNVFFYFQPEKIKMKSDGSCRSAPLEILNFGKYEAEEAEYIYKIINNGDVIFDIGAHIGWYALNFGKKYPNSKIFCFEPISYTYKYLIDNIHMNNITNINCYNYGLSDKEEEVSFHYFRGGSALSSPKNLINHEKTQMVNCYLKKLDDIFTSLKISKIDFMKIDVEGSELKVVKGALNTIKKFKPIIFIELVEIWCKAFEYSANDVKDILEKEGYKCFLPADNLYHVDKIKESDDKYNYLFFHGEKHEKLIQLFLSKDI